MGKLIEFITPLHKKTIRDYLARMVDEKVTCMIRSKEYGYDYWDGDRRFGYGGYQYDGRWKVVAQKLIEYYSLTDESRILDVGCGKAHLLYEIKRILPKSTCIGFDISRYGISDAPDLIKDKLFCSCAQDPYPWGDQYFDLVISLGCLHNLRIFELKTALSEIERVGKQKFILVESYRNELEMFNLECWALTAESIFDTAEWIWIYNHFGYTGDYEFIYFE